MGVIWKIDASACIVFVDIVWYLEKAGDAIMDIVDKLRFVSDPNASETDGPTLVEVMEAAAVEILALRRRCDSLAFELGLLDEYRRKDNAILIAEREALRGELAVWNSVFPDIAPDEVLPNRAVLEQRYRQMLALVRDVNDFAIGAGVSWGGSGLGERLRQCVEQNDAY